MHRNMHDTFRPMYWKGGRLHLLDQRLLPHEEHWLAYDNAFSVAEAIRDMVVRGAPAIGITAAYAVVLAARDAWRRAGEAWREAIEPALQALAAARPTAVNLFWALDRLRGRFAGITGDPEPALLEEARALHEEDIAANRRMGALGAELIGSVAGVLTHCNTGSLATGGFGTALGVVRTLWQRGQVGTVYADETRPWLQGSRLTAWELVQDGIPVTLVVEGAAASLLGSGRVQWVVVGADRIAANGDVANKVGTCNLAVLARHFGARFMVVAPTSTIDPQAKDGSAIPIETRAPAEVLGCAGRAVAPEGAGAWNPAFDVTPAQLVDAIVTERGVVERPAERGGVASLL
ncbi:MAG: S-methyl-5-thioribose-1-phosphate isomerase [Gammaproteobacteria bacterium]|nr:MAG: S-methyl-5-thioribose-1-phosphate isomerase [Gammaproteobacteria bacterium]